MKGCMNLVAALLMCICQDCAGLNHLKDKIKTERWGCSNTPGVVRPRKNHHLQPHLIIFSGLNFSASDMFTTLRSNNKGKSQRDMLNICHIACSSLRFAHLKSFMHSCMENQKSSEVIKLFLRKC